MVTLRRDGFGYLSKYDHSAPARFVTSPVRPTRAGTRIFLNLDQVTDKTPLTIELLDQKSRPIPAFSGDQAGILGTAGLHQEIIWPASKSSVIALEEPFSVRVKLPRDGDARVFAIYVSK